MRRLLAWALRRLGRRGSSPRPAPVERAPDDGTIYVQVGGVGPRPKRPPR